MGWLEKNAGVAIFQLSTSETTVDGVHNVEVWPCPASHPRRHNDGSTAQAGASLALKRVGLAR